jgi:NB-ARC domain
LGIKASQQGLARIRQAREQRGWNRNDPRWLVAVSRILEPDVDCQEYGPFAISESTWGRFLDGNPPIGREFFQACCRVLGLDWEEVAEKKDANQDWKGAPDVVNFYGRTEELNTLNQWLVADSCRLVVLWGIAGIGKTALAVCCAKQAEEKFANIVWRNLHDAPRLPELLANIISSLLPTSTKDLPNNIHRLISQLLDILHQRRVLLILDGWENILGGESAGFYQAGYEDYGQLLERMAWERHQSSLVITSREIPERMTAFAGENSPVRLWQLQGLGTAAQEILQAYQLKFTPKEGGILIQYYGGNPLALKLISSDIQVLFDGSVSAYLIKNTIVVPPTLQRLLKQSCTRLSRLEEEILCYLAREPEGIDSDNLRANISTQVSGSEFLENLSSLYQRSLLEKISQGSHVWFTLQPVVRKFVMRFYEL